ncbi:MAG: hypothetical protein ACLFQB_04645 [Chitinispirillaceae bacterium]
MKQNQAEGIICIIGKGESDYLKSPLRDYLIVKLECRSEDPG